MNTRFLETFVTVANLGSFRAAAEQLNVSQATVSSRISSLETDLQVDLFDREFHATRITVAGAMILETAQEMLATERNLRATLSDAPWLPLAEEGRITFLDSWPQFCSQDTCSAVQAGQGIPVRTWCRVLTEVPRLAPPGVVWFVEFGMSKEQGL